MSAPDPHSLAPLARPVRVRIPTAVATKIDLFQKAQLAILDRLGCPACCSGHDIRWDVVRDFAIDDDLNIREIGGGRFGDLG